MALYTFLDPYIFLGYRIPHLSLDQLPALADYDYTKNLVKRSFVVSTLGQSYLAMSLVIDALYSISTPSFRVESATCSLGL